jgi:uncharacterized protein with NAD-binding domain and iron-sulfur cluster
MARPPVHVIGGGLAGMTVARELARRGFTVRVIESSDHLGGKAGSVERQADEWEDHGYHIFPGWYANTLDLLRQLRCDKHLIPIRQTHALRQGEYPHFVTTKEWSGLTNLLYNLTHSVLHWSDHLLAIYSVLDLAAEPFSRRAYLDRVSVTGFLRSRFYASEELANFHHQTVLQSIAVPLYEVSAMTIRKTFRSWAQHPSPLFWILDGSLQQRFIAPLQDDMERRGVEVQTKRAVSKLHVHQGRVGAYELSGGPRVGEADDIYVLAVPHEVVSRIVGDSLTALDLGRVLERTSEATGELGIAGLANLRSAPIAALHLRLKRKIFEMPREHVSLHNSRFGISFIDVAPHWGLPHTTLNIIASNFAPLSQVDPMHARELLIAELRQYIPQIHPEDLPDDGGFLQTHVEQPFFLNTVGAWPSRPGAATAVDNLFLCGDYCRTDADLTTMEGAVMSGMNAAAAILERCGLHVPVAPKPIDEPPWLLLEAARLAVLPLIAPLGLWKLAQRQLREWRASD